MSIPIGLILLIAGFALVLFGISASDSISSGLSRAFTRLPSDRSGWMVVGGMIALVAGAILSWHHARR